MASNMSWDSIIDPLYLSSDELEHELFIRNISGLSTNRDKTKALRRSYEREAKNEEPEPKRLDLNPQAESDACLGGALTVSGEIKNAIRAKNEARIKECLSRLRFWYVRTRRISDQSVVGIKEARAALETAFTEVVTFLDNADKTGKNRQGEQQIGDSVNNEIHNQNNSDEQLKTPQIEVHKDPQSAPHITIGGIGRGTRLNNRFQENHAIYDQHQHKASEVPTAQEQEHQQLIELVKQLTFQVKDLQENQAKLQRLSETAHFREQERFGWQERTVNDERRNFQIFDSGPIQSREPTIRSDTFAWPDQRKAQHEMERPIKTPVEKWKIEFRGDAQGLSLNDFLARVELNARSGGISSTQLFWSIHHLLEGPAASWYRGNYREFKNWDELVSGMRREFLPRNYNFLLREEISNRVQQKSEKLSNFITDLKLLFQKVHPPLEEDYKLYIVKKNMLPEYAFKICTAYTPTLNHLVDVCKDLDETKILMDRRSATSMVETSLMEPSCFNLPKQKDIHFRRTFGEERRVSEMTQSYNEIDAIQQVMRCWNCHQSGHSFKTCEIERQHLFCFYCGMPEVTTRSCPKRHPLPSGGYQRPMVRSLGGGAQTSPSNPAHMMQSHHPTTSQTRWPLQNRFVPPIKNIESTSNEFQAAPKPAIRENNYTKQNFRNGVRFNQNVATVEADIHPYPHEGNDKREA